MGRFKSTTRKVRQHLLFKTDIIHFAPGAVNEVEDERLYGLERIQELFSQLRASRSVKKQLTGFGDLDSLTFAN